MPAREEARGLHVDDGVPGHRQPPFGNASLSVVGTVRGEVDVLLAEPLRVPLACTPDDDVENSKRRDVVTDLSLVTQADEVQVQGALLCLKCLCERAPEWTPVQGEDL